MDKWLKFIFIFSSLFFLLACSSSKNKYDDVIYIKDKYFNKYAIIDTSDGKTLRGSAIKASTQKIYVNCQCLNENYVQREVINDGEIEFIPNFSSKKIKIPAEHIESPPKLYPLYSFDACDSFLIMSYNKIVFKPEKRAIPLIFKLPLTFDFDLCNTEILISRKFCECPFFNDYLGLDTTVLLKDSKKNIIDKIKYNDIINYKNLIDFYFEFENDKVEAKIYYNERQLCKTFYPKVIYDTITEEQRKLNFYSSLAYLYNFNYSQKSPDVSIGYIFDENQNFKLGLNLFSLDTSLMNLSLEFVYQPSELHLIKCNWLCIAPYFYFQFGVSFDSRLREFRDLKTGIPIPIDLVKEMKTCNIFGYPTFYSLGAGFNIGLPFLPNWLTIFADFSYKRLTTPEIWQLPIVGDKFLPFPKNLFFIRTGFSSRFNIIGL